MEHHPGPQRSLFKLSPCGKKWPRPGVACLTQGKHETIMLSENTRPRALIFGMKHHQVDLYQVGSDYAPWPKMDPPWGHIFYISLYWENLDTLFLSRTLVFDMEHHPGPQRSLFKLSPCGKKWPRPGVACFTQVKLETIVSLKTQGPEP